MKKDKREEQLEILYTTNRPPHDIDLDQYKKQIEEHDEKFRNQGVPLPKSNKSTNTPLEIQLLNMNNIKPKKGTYPKWNDD